MLSKKALETEIARVSFSMDELRLFLDTHPTNQKAHELLCEYRRIRAEFVKAYEERFGEFIVSPEDVPASDCWKWLKGPWPWENDFMEA